MSNGNASYAKPEMSVEQYIAQNPNADPKSLLDILMQQNVRFREEARSAADVELDDRGEFKPRNLAGLWRLAKMYSDSQMVPDHYKGKPADCAIAIQMAMRCKVNILTFMQASYIVHGKPGVEAKLVIAMINASGQIKGRVRFKFEGEGKTRKCTAYATDATTGDILEQSVDWTMVEAEGWNTKSGSKWKTLPDLMFQYRAGAFLARVFFPDVLFGMYTTDELEDIAASELAPERAITTLDDLTDQLMGGGSQSEPLSSDALKPVASEATSQAETPADVAAEDANLLNGAVARFAECTELAQVTELKAELARLPLGDNQHSALDSMAEQARERIRSSRGPASNRQKQTQGA